MVFCAFFFFQGGIGEKGAEGTAGNDGARVSGCILFVAGLGSNVVCVSQNFLEFNQISLENDDI